MPSIRTDWDVVVIGGGTAGLMAGIAAARAGAQTLIVERSGFLAGNAATGMNLGGFFDGDEVQVVRGIPQEFVDRAVALGEGRGHVFFRDVDRWISSTASIDPEAYKRIALEKVQEAGCSVWFYATFIQGLAEAGNVCSVQVATKSGPVSLNARVYVDASGDADLAASVGAPFERGDGIRRQAVTCMFRLSHVDLPAVERFMEERINTDGKTPWTFENAPLRASHRYWTPWKIFPEYAAKFPRQFGIYYHGRPGEIFVNCTHTPLDTLEPDDITASTARLHRQAVETLDFLRALVPGFERSTMTQIYDLGIRESRRIVGEYVLTVEDLVTRREFEDVVAMGAYPPDLHDAHGGEILISGTGWSRTHSETGFPNNPGYHIPFRSLLPQGIGNLLVAGRCISATFEAQSGTRGMGPCGSMGQAAGTAAALAVQQRAQLRALEVRTVQEALLKGGAYLGTRFDSMR
jgi:FAD-dependent oxidoreductase family protein